MFLFIPTLPHIRQIHHMRLVLFNQSTRMWLPVRLLIFLPASPFFRIIFYISSYIFICMKKSLINMGDAFQVYYDLGYSRSVPRLLEKLKITHPKQCPSLDTLKKWYQQDEWKYQAMLMDKEIREGVKEKMMPEWVEVKVYLLKTLIEQVKKGREAGIAPEKTGDLVAAIREIRSMMGESDSTDVNITGIEYVPYQKKEENEMDHSD